MNKEILALNVKGEFYRIYNYCRCSNCSTKTDNANIKLAFGDEGSFDSDWWLCPQCYHDFRESLSDLAEGRDQDVFSFFYGRTKEDEDHFSWVFNYSEEELWRKASELYEVHRVWELEFMDEVTYYKYK